MVCLFAQHLQGCAVFINQIEILHLGKATRLNVVFLFNTGKIRWFSKPYICFKDFSPNFKKEDIEARITALMSSFAH
jgi:hypothetical protein